MPLFIVNTNVTASKEQKSQLAGAITEVVVKALKTSTSHVHVHIKDDVFFSFGGDAEAPAAHVLIKSAAKSIERDARSAIVAGLLPALQASLSGLSGDRVYCAFEELPVENIAVGSSIMSFTTMHTAPSMTNL